jgi:hypothetical protein
VEHLHPHLPSAYDTISADVDALGDATLLARREVSAKLMQHDPVAHIDRLDLAIISEPIDRAGG